MQHQKIIKKANDTFEVLGNGTNGKAYSMKKLGSYIINEIPRTSFDISDLSDTDQGIVKHYMLKGLRHDARRRHLGQD